MHMCTYTFTCTDCIYMDLTDRAGGGRTHGRLVTAVFLGERSSLRGDVGGARRSFSFIYNVSNYGRKLYPHIVNLIKKK